MRSRKAGFTLIEVMLAVGIIMILAGLMLGGMKAARRKAKRTDARNDVAQIVQAWTAYELDYKHFPDVGDGDSFDIKDMGEDGLQILRGSYDLNVYSGHKKYSEKNPMKKAYLDFHEASNGYFDPWGNLYQVRLDTALYDGMVDVPHDGGTTLRSSVAVWSKGPDGVDATADDICSWKER